MLLQIRGASTATDIDGTAYWTVAKDTSSTSTRPGRLWFHYATSVCSSRHGCDRVTLEPDERDISWTFPT